MKKRKRPTKFCYCGPACTDNERHMKLSTGAAGFRIPTLHAVAAIVLLLAAKRV